MKYFTPELFVAANSADAEMADRAARAWDDTSAAYLKYIKRVGEKLPTPIRTFLQRQNLHDAELLPARPQARGFAPFWIRTGVDAHGVTLDTSLSFQQVGAELTLQYKGLLDKPTIRRPVESPIFSEQNMTCLYDEFGIGKSGNVSHDILFGNGYVVTILFRKFSFFERHILEAPTLESEPSRQRRSTG
jgi:hypothetical protein